MHADEFDALSLERERKKQHRARAIQRAAELFRGGETKRSIAARLGVTKRCVQKYLRLAGL